MCRAPSFAPWKLHHNLVVRFLGDAVSLYKHIFRMRLKGFRSMGIASSFPIWRYRSIMQWDAHEYALEIYGCTAAGKTLLRTKPWCRRQPGATQGKAHNESERKEGLSARQHGSETKDVVMLLSLNAGLSETWAKLQKSPPSWPTLSRSWCLAQAEPKEVRACSDRNEDNQLSVFPISLDSSVEDESSPESSPGKRLG